MPFRGRSVGEERLRFVDLVLAGEKSISQLCGEFGISRQCGHTWLNRYREGGAAAVISGRSRRPLHSPARTCEDLESEILELRRRWPDWGAPKLQRLLLKANAAHKISVSTVHRILARNHLIHRADSHPQALRQFEREAPNQLWQMDFKGPKGFRERSGPLSVIDDHSRYLVALEHLESGKIEAVQGCLRRAFENHGVPEAMLMDHGTPWWNASSPWGWTELTVWLMRQGVRILMSGYRHPQTQGKVERMHGALHRALKRRHADGDAQSWLDEFRREYNEIRPHEALAMEVPVSRWKPSTRVFRAEPEQWQYPDGHDVATVDDKGRIRCKQGRFSLSKALTGQTVGVKVIGDRPVVYFCNTPLAELTKDGAVRCLDVDPFRSLQC